MSFRRNVVTALVVVGLLYTSCADAVDVTYGLRTRARNPTDPTPKAPDPDSENVQLIPTGGESPVVAAPHTPTARKPAQGSDQALVKAKDGSMVQAQKPTGVGNSPGHSPLHPSDKSAAAHAQLQAQTHGPSPLAPSTVPVAPTVSESGQSRNPHAVSPVASKTTAADPLKAAPAPMLGNPASAVHPSAAAHLSAQPARVPAANPVVTHASALGGAANAVAHGAVKTVDGVTPAPSGNRCFVNGECLVCGDCDYSQCNSVCVSIR
eukprot:GFYU01014419.1.p1 GENE.GFYU01014419.1~~GFYU01014419.1.p1  ORF type:complete len:265 (-),score=41.48 GFYU01014419.1:346-1140(-)